MDEQGSKGDPVPHSERWRVVFWLREWATKSPVALHDEFQRALLQAADLIERGDHHEGWETAPDSTNHRAILQRLADAPERELDKGMDIDEWAVVANVHRFPALLDAILVRAREYGYDVPDVGQPRAENPLVCPRCGADGDRIDGLGDPLADGGSEHVLCLRCGLCWAPGGHSEEWPCTVCAPQQRPTPNRERALELLRHVLNEHMGDTESADVGFVGEALSLLEREAEPDHFRRVTAVRAIIDGLAPHQRRRMFAAAVFLGEPGCTEIRKLLLQLTRIDQALR